MTLSFKFHSLVLTALAALFSAQAMAQDSPPPPEPVGPCPANLAENDSRCTEAGFEVCIEGERYLIDCPQEAPCAEHPTLAMASCFEPCDEATFEEVCDANNARTCFGGLVIDTPCFEGGCVGFDEFGLSICEGDPGASGECPEGTDGAGVCTDDGDIELCFDGYVDTIVCEGESTCGYDAYGFAACTIPCPDGIANGETRCDGDQIQECVDGNLFVTFCAEGDQCLLNDAWGGAVCGVPCDEDTLDWTEARCTGETTSDAFCMDGLAMPLDCGEGTECVELLEDGAPECMVSDAQACGESEIDEDGHVVIYWWMCAGEASSCNYDLGTGVATCEPLAQPLEHCEPDMPRYCVDDDVLALDCDLGRPLTVSCASGGGVCNDGRCESPEGATCEKGQLVGCAEGLECTDYDANGLGTCQPATSDEQGDGDDDDNGPADAGLAEPPGGGSAESPAPSPIDEDVTFDGGDGAGCNAAQGTVLSPHALAALMYFANRRRRRRKS